MNLAFAILPSPEEHEGGLDAGSMESVYTRLSDIIFHPPGNSLFPSPADQHCGVPVVMTRPLAKHSATACTECPRLQTMDSFWSPL